MTAHKPMTPAEHIARAKSEALAGDASYAVAHALIAIAEQGQPVEHIIEHIDLDELERQQPPVLLTQAQIARAGTFLRHWALDQLGVAGVSVGYSEQVARRLVGRINEADVHNCEYDDPNKCAWPGHRR